MTHLEPLVFRILNEFSVIGRLISNIIIAIISLYSALLIVRTNNPTSSELIDFAIVSGVTLFAIYHRLHDIFLIFPGLIYIYLRVLSPPQKTEKIMLIAIIVGTLFVFTLPGDFMANLTNQNPDLADSYLWRVIAPIHTWAILIVLGAVIFYKRQGLAVQDLKAKPVFNVIAR